MVGLTLSKAHIALVAATDDCKRWLRVPSHSRMLEITERGRPLRDFRPKHLEIWASSELNSIFP